MVEGADQRDLKGNCDAASAQTSPEADPDGDGIPNAVEYALDLTPTWADRSQMPEGFVAAGPTQAGYHGLTYRRRAGASDLSYEVQVSTDLEQWTGNSASPQTMEILVTTLGDGMESVTVRTLYTVSGLPAHFLRLRVGKTGN